MKHTIFNRLLPLLLIVGLALSGCASGDWTELVVLDNLTATTINASYLYVSANQQYLQPFTGAGSSSLQIGGNDSKAIRILMDAYGNTPALTFRKAEGTTNSPSAIQANSQLGELSVHGYGANQYITTGVAHIRAEAVATWNNTSAPTRWIFDTTATGSTTPVLAMTINSNAFVGIGQITPLTSLTVSGTHIVGKGIVYVTGNNSHAYITMDGTGTTNNESGLIFKQNDIRAWQIKNVQGILQFNQGVGTNIVANVTSAGWSVNSLNSTSNLTASNITSINPQICILSSSVNWTISSSSPTNLNWNTVIRDPSNLNSADGNITVSVPGYYQVVAMVHWAVNSTGARQVGIQLDGSYIAKQTAPAAPVSHWLTVTGMVYANAGQKLSVVVFQNSGGNLTIVADGTQAESYFSIMRIIG